MALPAESDIPATELPVLSANLLPPPPTALFNPPAVPDNTSPAPFCIHVLVSTATFRICRCTHLDLRQRKRERTREEREEN